MQPVRDRYCSAYESIPRISVVARRGVISPSSCSSSRICNLPVQPGPWFISRISLTYRPTASWHARFRKNKQPEDIASGCYMLCLSGAPTRLADGFGLKGLPYRRHRRIHPTKWFPRSLGLGIRRAIRFRFERRVRVLSGLRAVSRIKQGDANK
jgi:hypothetical protein